MPPQNPGTARWPASIPDHSLRLAREFDHLSRYYSAQNIQAVPMDHFLTFGRSVVGLHEKIVTIYRNLVQKLPAEEREAYDWYKEGPEPAWKDAMGSEDKDGNGGGGKNMETSMDGGSPNGTGMDSKVQTGAIPRVGMDARGFNSQGNSGGVMAPLAQATPPEARNGGGTPILQRVQEQIDIQRERDEWMRRYRENKAAEDEAHNLKEAERSKQNKVPFGWAPPPSLVVGQIKARDRMEPARPKQAPPFPFPTGEPSNRKDPTRPKHTPLQESSVPFGLMPLPFLTGELPEGPNRKRKREHDPNAPKRSKSAFIIFSNEQRDKVREENPGITFGEIGALLGKRWREMPADERAIWEAKSTADSKRYAEEKAAYKVARAESPVGEYRFQNHTAAGKGLGNHSAGDNKSARVENPPRENPLQNHQFVGNSFGNYSYVDKPVAEKPSGDEDIGDKTTANASAGRSSGHVVSGVTPAVVGLVAVHSPRINATEVNSPGINTPKAISPGVNTPEDSTPDTNSPDANSPGVNSPGASSPGANSPGVNTPGINTPVVNTPFVSAPVVNDGLVQMATRNGPQNPSPARNAPR